MKRLDGRVALISGGARGMGAAEARLFVAQGASVVVGDILDDQGGALAAELGSAARYLHHDVRDEEAWAEAVGLALRDFGRLDILVNNAGIFRSSRLVETSLDDYMRIIWINQVGTFLGMRAAAPAMIENGGGSIINISSVAGLRGGPGLTGYGSSKWAIRGMTKVAATELASYNIRVNSVHPGGVDTDMIDDIPGADEIRRSPAAPMGRLGTVDDVANVVLWLASDESCYATGAEFVIDGGGMAG